MIIGIMGQLEKLSEKGSQSAVAVTGRTDTMWPLFFAGEIGAIVYSWAGGFKIFKTVIKRVESHHHHHEVREKFDSSCVKGAKKTTGGFPPSSLSLV